MEILSFQETAKIATEADALCKTIEQNYDDLRDGRLKRQGAAEFKVLQKGRNIVYRVQDNSGWYLKIPCKGKANGIEGEALGFRKVAEYVAQEPSFRHAKSIRVSQEPRYILASAIPGKQLNLKLYRNCLNPFGNETAEINQYFRDFGGVLATLHAARIDPGERKTSLDAVKTFENRLGRVKKPDALSREIADWFGSFSPPNEEDAFVHGNCTMRNILVHGGKLSLIDFETCGAGNRYFDLGMLCRDLILCRSAIAFPKRRAEEALAAFVSGYEKVFGLDRTTLDEHMTLFVASHYLQVHRIKQIKESISGFPVLKPRLEKMVRNMLSSEKSKVLQM